MVKKKTIFLSLLLVILIFSGSLVFYFNLKAVRAGSDDDTEGFAWSETIGWVSFNSESDGSSVNYGVNIDNDTGYLSGYAWSEHLGWLSFERGDTGAPPSNDVCSGGGCIARLENSDDLGVSDADVVGWARFLANGGGWDGWVRFDHGQTGEVYIDSSGDWHGWAWSDMVLGWLSFNSNDSGVGSGASYKVVSVVNQAPVASGLSNNADSLDYCFESPGGINLNWDYNDANGDVQQAYEMEIKRLSDDEVEFYQMTSDSTSQFAGNINSYMGYNFIWYDSSGSGYDWRVRVQDDNGKWSNWSSWDSFNVPLHSYPDVDFYLNPDNPSAGEPVEFHSDVSCYDGDGSCDNFAWDVNNDGSIESLDSNMGYTFTSSGDYNVKLTVSDSESYTCNSIKSIEINLPLPSWKEIFPW